MLWTSMNDTMPGKDYLTLRSVDSAKNRNENFSHSYKMKYGTFSVFVAS